MYTKMISVLKTVCHIPFRRAPVALIVFLLLSGVGAPVTAMSPSGYRPCPMDPDCVSGPVATQPPQTAAPTPNPDSNNQLPSSGGLVFSDQTQAANVAMSHSTPLDPKEDGARMMGGAAAGDFNNDGWEDLFVIGGGLRADALFINQGDGTFQDVAETAGLSELHIGSGAAVGDYDEDGWLDIFVTSFGDPDAPGPGQHRLYHNNGDLTFTDVAQSAGVNQTSAALADGFGAAFGDYDLDGDLDLFVAGWRKDSAGNRLFRNHGDGTFDDVTNASGIIDDGIRGFTPCFADMDGDRYPELLLVADFGTSRYFVNNGGVTFSEYTDASGTGLEWSGMGSAVNDFTGDGLLEWYTTAIYDDDDSGRGDGNKLYINQGEHSFTEAAQASGVDDGGWGWGTVAVDLNHDGWLDIVETNGWELPAYTAELAKVWLNNGDNTFMEAAAATGFDHALDGLGLLNLDYDNDGDQDIVVTAPNDELRLYRNDLAGGNAHWFRVFLDTQAVPDLAPNGFGSRIVLHSGGQTYYRYLDGCSHYLSQSELSAHFGLGAASIVDELRVEWANGAVTVLNGLAADQSMTISATELITMFIPLILK